MEPPSIQRRPTFCVLLTVLLLGVAILGGCHPSGPVVSEDSAESKSAAGDFKRYEVRGEVVQLDAAKRVATIKHEEIVGWMDAMTMSFPVTEPTEWDKLSVGAQIRATLFVNDDGFHLGEIEVLKPQGQSETPDGAGNARPSQ
jgi:protein SCO1